MQEVQQTTTLRDFLKVLFRQKAVFLTCFITVILTVIIGVQFQTPVYEASVKIMVSAEKQVESPYYRELLGERNAEVTLSQSEIVTSNPVLERAVRAAGIPPFDYEKAYASPIKKPFISLSAKSLEKDINKYKDEQRMALIVRLAMEELKRNIKVEPIRDTNLFNIVVRDFDPGRSATLANIVSRSYVIFDLEQQLAETQLKYGEKHPATLQLRDSINGMLQNLKGGRPLPVVDSIGPASVKIIEQVLFAPIKPAGMPKAVTIVLAVFMAIFLGVMLAFLFEYMDQSFKTPQEVESFLNLPYLGAIPKNAKPELYHALADQIYLLLRDKQFKTLQFFSALEQEGVTNTIVNLAGYYAKMGHKVLIIDANLRGSSVNKFFRLADSNGLADILEGKLQMDKAVKQAMPNLDVITAGKTGMNPITLLDSTSMQDVLKVAKDRYEIVLIDVPCLREYKDAAILSSKVDGNCLIVTEGVTRKQVVKAALDSVIEKNATILGVVLNNRSFELPKIIYDIS